MLVKMVPASKVSGLGEKEVFLKELSVCLVDCMKMPAALRRPIKQEQLEGDSLLHMDHLTQQEVLLKQEAPDLSAPKEEQEEEQSKEQRVSTAPSSAPKEEQEEEQSKEQRVFTAPPSAPKEEQEEEQSKEQMVSTAPSSAPTEEQEEEQNLTRHQDCRMGSLYQSGHPTAYCKLNQDVPILRIWFNVEAELQQDFRLSRRAMQGLQRLLQRQQDHGWGSQFEVLIYVYWLAHGLSYRVVSRVFSVPKSTVHRVVHRVARLIWRNLKLAIRFPAPEELDAIGQGFGQLSGTPVLNCVVGAIDGCHFRIKPPSLHRMHYLNYKGFFSINMQAICDYRGKFLDIFVGYPGSVHDTHIMKNSTFYQAQQYPPTGYIILGDGGYPCLDKPICLITPYREPVGGRTESRFNYHHSRGRSIVERSFGVLKTRWRSTLFRALEVRPTFAPMVIATCAFLHNVCLDNGDMLEPDHDVAQDIFDPQPPREALVANERPGSAKRDELAALISGHVQDRQ